MILDSLLADLINELPHAVRFQRLVRALRQHFRCDAACLLRLDSESLRPVAAEGLVREALGRRFLLERHPRLAAILASRQPVRFEACDPRPDPYEGLVDMPGGSGLQVHDCMGVSLHVEGRPWGALTLDALAPGTFDAAARQELQRRSLVVEAAVRVSLLEQRARSERQAQATQPAQGLAPAADDEILGHSAAMRQLLREIDVVADSELPVLLLGETGVGKELFARRLHRSSRRSARPLVHVNCAALPESLAESELFGHMKGAFSGATAERAGRFEAAHGGTLFLDEVGELPLAVQAKLLRALQSGEVQRLGADQPRRVDVRVIAATNRDLGACVHEGHFRADLYHRLSVYPVHIPPLREREGDALTIAGHFLELNRTRLGLRALRLAPEAEAAVLSYRWPGNVRELEHAISRAAVKALSRGAGRGEIVSLGVELLDIERGGAAPEPAVAAGSPGRPPAAPAGPLKELVERTQRDAIASALSLHHGNWAAAARALELDASNLHKLARRLGLKTAAAEALPA
ncbi:nitric oxide reductase transcriptional regulator NorR [Caldimonas tepidiphila]|uniref:nitric oxide reductase transcriptional regulator NorR n=1 Tax=Caldimonas tepidiphila TaxID=2315841 RepID=UPI000E5ADBF6|nr:nitric oxide reductase transcriptional regulator NorR [Caldimonas tepidiphila]